MKKKMKKVLVLMLVLCLTLNMAVPVEAASKNVTKKYKKTVSKMLEAFDEYFIVNSGYTNSTHKFVLNNNVKSSMICYKVYKDHSLAYAPRTVKQAQKACKSQLKLYFGSSAKFKLRKYSNINGSKKYLYLYQNDNGYLNGIQGQMGGEYVAGKVKKIIKTSSKKFTVTYKVYTQVRNRGEESIHNYSNATFKIYLKKANNKYGFIITNIKRA